MGVMNITPNSFSDGAEFNDESATLSKIEAFKKFKSSWFDVGAESTAPFNDPISFKEEWTRIDSFMTKYLDCLKDFSTISVDTYKINTINAFLDKYKDNFSHVVWNDVSGDALGAVDVLNKYQDISYVLSHNLSPKRELTSDHMNYLAKDIISDVKGFFIKELSILEKNGIAKNRIYLDPCFGFSKTRDQNYELLKNFAEIYPLSNRWLIGVSRKSFLQALTGKELKQDAIAASEFFHFQILCDLMNFNKDEMIFRVHDQSIFDMAISAQVFKLKDL